MYVLDFMGLAVLDPEFSRPMLPWVVREVIFRADPRQVQMTIKDDQIEFHEIGESRKAEHAFHSDGYKIKDVYHPAHNPNSFAFVTREASSTPCSCYVFKQTKVEVVEQVVKKLKHEVGTGKRKRLGETTGESELVSYEVALLGKSTVVTEKPNQELIDSVIEEFKINSEVDPPLDIEVSRPNSINYENARHRSGTTNGVLDSNQPDTNPVTRQRSHSYDTSHFKPENKTKIFQIGSDRLTVIDTDGPGVLDVKFSRVSRCVQGVKHKACFGFVAREPKKSKVTQTSSPQFALHVFQCFDDQTCEDIMIAIRQAFSSSLRPITPLHVFHRLCVKLNHTNDLQTRLTIVSNLVEQVSEGEKFYISQKLKTLTPGDANERLVLTVAVLRELYEVKNREQQLVGGNGLKKPTFVTLASSENGTQKSHSERNTPTNEINPVADLLSDTNGLSDLDTTGSPTKSLRQTIYESVSANPTLSQVDPNNSPFRERGDVAAIRTPAGIKEAWQQAIREQKLLNRIIKISELSKTVNTPAMQMSIVELWDDLLKTDFTLPSNIFKSASYLGIPDESRGKIWLHMADQREKRCGTQHQSDFKSLINQLAPPSQAHSILIDLCRTFPKHRQFRESLAQSTGQKSLYNVLKAYCLLDTEVGYCQGLSFVVGLILIYLPDEEDAFKVLRHLMFNCNMRRYYLPDMISLQEAMYQLSRLLSDQHPELYSFLEYNGITPVLYLTPWFLTIFASNFPLNFAVRVLDMVIAEGPSAIFKFSLAILLSKKDDMMKLEGFETVADYIKNHLNDIDDTLIRHLVATSSHIEFNGSLDTYATEYSVLSENDLLREPGQNWSPSKDIVRDLRVQNRKLKEQVSIQDTQIQALQDSLREIEDQATRQKETTKKLSELEIERDDLKELVSKLSEQLGNLSAEQNTFNSRNSTPC